MTLDFAQQINYNRFSFLWIRIETLINADGGGSTLDVFAKKLNSVNGIEDDINALIDATVFPNPTQGLFTISVTTGFSEVEILNTLGSVVQSKKINGASNPVFEILENGVYFIRIKKDQNIITKKLIVNN